MAPTCAHGGQGHVSAVLYGNAWDLCPACYDSAEAFHCESCGVLHDWDEIAPTGTRYVCAAGGGVE